jgi:uncharacterized protein
MTVAEWESLCDGCGLCCLIRLEDEDTGEVVPTKVHCRLFDPKTCGCTDYVNRKKVVTDCVKLTPGNIDDLYWMPPSCAYRRLNEGKALPRWHHLVSGDPELVHSLGISVRGKTINEQSLDFPEEAADYVDTDFDLDKSHL